MQSYNEKVYAIVKKIPRGKVSTYKDIAFKLKIHPRAVAVALKTNRDTVNIPCYKVIHSSGLIGGYSCLGGINKKIQLLKADGIKIKNNKIEKIFFHA